MTHYELLTVVASYLAQPTPVLRQGTKLAADLRSRIVGKLANKGKLLLRAVVFYRLNKGLV